MDLFPADLLRKFKVVDWAYTEEPEAISYSRFNKWQEGLDENELTYLQGKRGEQRKSLKSYFPEFQSALVFLFSYAREREALQKFYEKEDSNSLKIASYVFFDQGRDYHLSIRDSLEELKQQVLKKFGPQEIKFSLDTQPILERDLAYRAGLGWFGKNSMLISRKYGSFHLIGSLLMSKTLPFQETRYPDTDHCGQCRACLDICPTDAFHEDLRTLDPEKCISYFTIEKFKDAAPMEGYSQGEGYIFGCDLCQDVCPWNKREERVNIEESIELVPGPVGKFLSEKNEDLISTLEGMSNREFRKVFKGTPLERTGRIGMLKNLRPYSSKKV